MTHRGQFEVICKRGATLRTVTLKFSDRIALLLTEVCEQRDAGSIESLFLVTRLTRSWDGTNRLNFALESTLPMNTQHAIVPPEPHSTGPNFLKAWKYMPRWLQIIVVLAAIATGILLVLFMKL